MIAAAGSVRGRELPWPDGERRALEVRPWLVSVVQFAAAAERLVPASGAHLHVAHEVVDSTRAHRAVVACGGRRRTHPPLLALVTERDALHPPVVDRELGEPAALAGLHLHITRRATRHPPTVARSALQVPFMGRASDARYDASSGRSRVVGLAPCALRARVAEANAVGSPAATVRVNPATEADESPVVFAIGDE